MWVSHRQRATLRVPWLHGRSPRPAPGGLFAPGQGWLHGPARASWCVGPCGPRPLTDRWWGLPGIRLYTCPRVRAVCNVTGGRSGSSCPHPKDSSSPAASLQKDRLCCPLPGSWLRAQSPRNFLGDRSDFIPTRRLLVAPQELQDGHLAPGRSSVAGGSGLSAPPVISRTGTGQAVQLTVHQAQPAAGPESCCWKGVRGLGWCTPRCPGADTPVPAPPRPHRAPLPLAGWLHPRVP